VKLYEIPIEANEIGRPPDNAESLRRNWKAGSAILKRRQVRSSRRHVVTSLEDDAQIAGGNRTIRRVALLRNAAKRLRPDAVPS